jgi:hypothetical protein
MTPTPSFQAQTQSIGPVWDDYSDSRYTAEVTVTDVEWYKGGSYDQPKSGSIHAIVHIQFQNNGPGSIRSIGSGDFQALDASGVVHDYEFLSATEDCRLDIVDLMAGGHLEGCVAFEVPEEGRIEFIYAPYRYEGLEPGRYLSFVLRE